jgi:hypothetical protein
LTAVAALLDALDTDNTAGIVELDVAAHGETLRDAVAVMLPVLERAVADTRADDPATLAREDELRLMRQFAAQLTRATGVER